MKRNPLLGSRSRKVDPSRSRSIQGVDPMGRSRGYVVVPPDRPPIRTDFKMIYKPSISKPLLGHLIDAGVLWADGVSRRARLVACPRCRQAVIRGLDDPDNAMEARCDPWPLSVQGEVAALVEGLGTFDLSREGDGRALDYRYAESIQGRPAGLTPDWDVVVEHRCGRGPQGVAPSMIRAKTYIPYAAVDFIPF